MPLSPLHRASQQPFRLNGLPVHSRLGPWLLVLCLVAAQLLGMMHRIVHAPSAGHGPALAAVATAVADRADADTGMPGLFATHDGNHASCELYDAHAQGGVPSIPVLPLLAAEICFLGNLFQPAPPLPAQTLFEARAPPFLR